MLTEQWQNISAHLFYVFPQEPLIIQIATDFDFQDTAYIVLLHEKQPLCSEAMKKVPQAALVNRDVTSVMDESGPASATTCLFQASIVWRSVITVCVASQQPVSCAYYPFAHKRKKDS